MGVFGSNQVYTGSFKADLLKLQFGGKQTGLLIQNMQFTFQQQVSLMFEVGSENAYYVGGRAQGTATVGRIVGPGATVDQFFTLYGNICTPEKIEFSAEGGCGGAAAGAKYTLEAAVLTSVGCSVNAEQIVITEQLQFMFLDLLRGDGPTAPAPAPAPPIFGA